ncbi:MAG: hypothetical protein ACRC1W_13250 [Shewanella sp.]
MAVEVLRRAFSNDLQKVLFPDNSFYAGCKSDDAAIDTENIEIPQDENGAASVIVNPTKFPLEMRTEEDSKKTYAADLLVTIPEVITYNNQLLTNYDKRAAKLQKHSESLEKDLAERIMFGWANTVTNFKIPTTGVATRPNEATPGGNVKKVVTEADVLRVLRIMRLRNIPIKGLRCVCTPDIYEDLLAIKKGYGSGTDANNKLLADGAIDKIFNFDVYMRSETTRYSAGGAKKAIGAAAAATDGFSAIFYHPMFVRYIKGSVLVNMDPYNVPGLAGGRSMNAMVRGGGTSGRNSELGVVTLYQAE